MKNNKPNLSTSGAPPKPKKTVFIVVFSIVLIWVVGKFYISNNPEKLTVSVGIPIEGNYTVEEKKSIANEVGNIVWNNNLKQKILKDVSNATMEDLDNGLHISVRVSNYSTVTETNYSVHILCHFKTTNSSLNRESVTNSCGKHFQKELIARNAEFISRK